MKCIHWKGNRERNRNRGFTLIELLLVLAILAILAAIVLPRITGRTSDAQIKATQAQISAFKTALNLFEVDNGFYPRSLADLLQQPRDAQNWKGPYLDNDTVPKDPWGNDYIYVYPGRRNANSYDLSSPG
ncbi:MAG TPA: type II secretion system major pseudopilin GspG, partial [Verrucomicrobiota bacterium]|nr:type II secretion system major pseudopilin GspG [Verrucomicrobiota bacterium]